MLYYIMRIVSFDDILLHNSAVREPSIGVVTHSRIESIETFERGYLLVYRQKHRWW